MERNKVFKPCQRNLILFDFSGHLLLKAKFHHYVCYFVAAIYPPKRRPWNFKCLNKSSVTVSFFGLDNNSTTLFVPYVDSCFMTCSTSIHGSAFKLNNWFTNYFITATFDDSALSFCAQYPEILHFTIAYYWKHLARKQLRDLYNAYRKADSLCLFRFDKHF